MKASGRGSVRPRPRVRSEGHCGASHICCQVTPLACLPAHHCESLQQSGVSERLDAAGTHVFAWPPHLWDTHLRGTSAGDKSKRSWRMMLNPKTSTSIKPQDFLPHRVGPYGAVQHSFFLKPLFLIEDVETIDEVLLFYWFLM